MNQHYTDIFPRTGAVKSHRLPGRIVSCWSFLFMQEVDTTSVGYRIGYQLGSWLPVIIILILALAVIWKGYRRRNDEPQSFD